MNCLPDAAAYPHIYYLSRTRFRSVVSAAVLNSHFVLIKYRRSQTVLSNNIYADMWRLGIE